MPQANAYTAGMFTFELDDGKPVGFVSSVDGGHFKSAGAVTSMVGADNYVTKYAGRPTYDDIVITIGTAMSPAFWKWVRASLDRKPERRNGALVGYDFKMQERTRRTFYGALISEIGFPALDAGAKSSAALTIKIAPERIEFKEGDHSKLSGGQAQDQLRKQKRWLPSNFRFELDRFKGDPALQSAKVDAFAVKQNIIQNPIGHSLEAHKEPGRLELPALVVTFPEAHMAPWMRWYDEAVAKGERRHQYTTGVITYYDSSRSELMRLELGGVSLLSLEIEKYEAHKEAISSCKATLNLESLSLTPGQGNA